MAPSDPSPVRVLLADDDPLVRRALRQVLPATDLEIVAEAADGRQAVDAALVERPDVVLMDIDMPVMDGITATLRIRRRLPTTQVVLLSTAEDAELGLLGLRAGAAGFLSKDVSAEALGRALRGVPRGEAAVSRTLMAELIERLRRLPAWSSGMRPIRSDLTTREWQVLDLMCAGASTEGIAQELVLSIETVRSHIKRILQKLGAHSRAEAVQLANRVRDVEAPQDNDEAAQADEDAFRRTFERLRDRGRRSR